MGDAPVGNGEGQDAVDDDRTDGGEGEAPVVGLGEHHGGDDQLDEGRAKIEDQGPEQEVHRTGAAVDDAAERAGALGLVKLDRQAERMAEGVGGGAALGSLGDRGEDHVAQLRRGGGEEADQGPSEDEAGKGRPDLHGGRLSGGEAVYGGAEQQRGEDAQHLAAEGEDEGGGQAPGQAGGLAGHDQAEEIGQGGPGGDLDGRR